MKHVGMVALLTLVLAGPGCGHRKDPSVIPASGQIEATEVRLSTKVGGVLLDFPETEGDPVRAGQVVARVDTTDVALQLAAARADREQAEADLDLREAGSRPEEIAQAQAQVERARADLDGADRDLARMQALLESGSGTAKSRDDARTRRDIASAALDQAREQLRQRKNGSRPQEIEGSRARLHGAEARIAQLAQQIRDAALASPIDGVITEKLAERGELLAPGTAVCVITDLAHPWLTAYVSEPDLARIRLGQEAEVLAGSGVARTGRIGYISPQAEFTPKNVQTREERTRLVFKIKIELDNRDGLFKPGMPAEARLRAATAP